MSRAALALAAAVVCGCSASEVVEPAPEPLHLEGDMSLELRDTMHVLNTGAAGSDDTARPITVELTPSAGFGLLAAGTKLSVEGRLEPFPEASSVLYVAKVSGAPQNGACGKQPISLALSLHRRLGASMVVGGLSAYCGANRWHGTPVRILRLSGALSQP
jgi:hypothetical protein